MLYHVFFLEVAAVCPRTIVSEADEQIKDFQQRIASITADGEILKKQLGEKEAEIKNSVVTIEQLKQQIQKLTDEMKSSQNQLRVYEEKLKDKDSQIQKALDKLKIKEEEAQKAADKLKEEKELVLKKEELMRQKIEETEGQLNKTIEDFKKQKTAELSKPAQDNQWEQEAKKKISDYEVKLTEISKKNDELSRQLKIKEEEIRQEKERENSEFIRKNEELLNRIDELNKQIAESAEEGRNSEQAEGELNDRQKQLWEYLKENKKITRKEYIDKFNVSVPTAARDFKELQDRNIIKPHGPLGQGRYFVLTEDGE